MSDRNFHRDRVARARRSLDRDWAYASAVSFLRSLTRPVPLVAASAVLSVSATLTYLVRPFAGSGLVPPSPLAAAFMIEVGLLALLLLLLLWAAIMIQRMLG